MQDIDAARARATRLLEEGRLSGDLSAYEAHSAEVGHLIATYHREQDLAPRRAVAEVCEAIASKHSGNAYTALWRIIHVLDPDLERLLATDCMAALKKIQKELECPVP